MVKYLVITKIYDKSINGDDLEAFHFHCEQYESPHILDLLKEISRDNTGLKYDIVQITLIS